VLENPGCPFLMGGPSHEMTRDHVVPAFEAACPPSLVLGYNKTDKVFRLKGGRLVKHFSADKPSTVEAWNAAGFWGDEVRYWKHETWRNLLGRLRARRARRIQGIVSSTPAMNWMADEFDAGRTDRAVYRASTRENAHNLAPGYIEDLERSYSARLARSLIDGEFSVISGQVYEEFDEQLHAVDWTYDPRHPLWLSWDFGIRASSVLVAQVLGDFRGKDRAGRSLPPHSIVIFDELQIEQKPTIHQIPDVKRRLEEIGRAAGLSGAAPLHRIVCDPAGKQRSQDSGIQNVALLQEAFGHIVRYEEDFVERHIPNRVQRVCGALKPVQGEPTLYVSKGVLSPSDPIAKRRGVVKALRGSVYDEKEGKRMSDLPRVDDLEHARDVTEYLVVRAQNETRRPTMTHRPALKFGHR
jgi:hypothetical protein